MSLSITRPFAASDSHDYPPEGRSWAIVMVFCLASIVSLIDRSILALVVDPIRHDLGISDFQISLLQGLSFGLFYAAVGVPLGLFADRMSRHRLLIAGITVWSIATIFGGLAQNFTQMFISRLLVGLGEATLAPCAVSMISDLFPQNRRGRPISVYLLGQAVANGLGIFVTALILRAAPTGIFAGVPVLDGLAPWRTVFVICGLSGFAVIALMFTFREPRRRGSALDDQSGVRGVIAYFVENRRFFLPFYAGYAFVSMHIYGLSAWGATYLMRGFGMAAADVGEVYGTAAIVGGAGGALVAGFAVDQLARRGVRTGKLQLVIGVCLFALPSALLVLAPSPGVAILLAAMGVAAMPMFGTTIISALPEVVPANMRGVAVSLLGLVATILGATTGPMFIALATEQLFGDPAMLGASITLVSIPALAIGALLFYLALRAWRAALACPGSLRDVLEAQRGG